MTKQSYGSRSRRPVVYSGKRVAGLWERTLKDGTTVYDVSLRLGGRSRRKRLDATTPTDAIAELRALQTDWARGVAPRAPGSGASVEDLAREWLVDLESRVGRVDVRQRRSKRTVVLYRSRLEAFVIPVIGNVAVAEVNVSDVRRVIANASTRGLAPSTTSSVLSILSGLLRFAVKLGALERNPARDLDRDDRPGVTRLSEPRYLSVEEVESLLSNMSDTFRPVATACAYAGLRVSEALGLVWGDVDLREGTLTISAQLGSRRRARRAEDGFECGDDPTPARARSRASRASLSRGRAWPGSRPAQRARLRDASWQAPVAAQRASRSPRGGRRRGSKRRGRPAHRDARSSTLVRLDSARVEPDAPRGVDARSPRVAARDSRALRGLSNEAREGATTKLAQAGFGA